MVELAGRFGISTWYVDWTDRHVTVPEATVVSVLAALGVAASTEQDRNEALTGHLKAYWARRMPATIVGRTGAQTRIWVHVTHGLPAEVWLQLEDGTVADGVQQIENLTPPFDLDGRWVGEASFVLPSNLPVGYHRVHLRSGDFQTSSALIVTPDWLGFPQRLGARRAWGLAAQLYSVRSGQSWGIGDLTDVYKRQAEHQRLDHGSHQRRLTRTCCPRHDSVWAIAALIERLHVQEQQFAVVRAIAEWHPQPRPAHRIRAAAPQVFEMCIRDRSRKSPVVTSGQNL